MNSSENEKSGVLELGRIIRQFESFEGDWPSFLEQLLKLFFQLSSAQTIVLAERSDDGFKLSLSFGDKRLVQKEMLENVDLGSDLQWGCLGLSPYCVLPLFRNSQEPDMAVLLIWKSELAKTRKNYIETVFPLFSTVPKRYLVAKALLERENDLRELGDILLLVNQLQDQKRFSAACVLLCNYLSDHFDQSETFIGWVKGDYIRIQASGKRPWLEKRMAIVEGIETAFEECATQDEEIFSDSEDHALNRAHERLRMESACVQVLSIPLRRNNAVIGVILIQLFKESISEQALRGLRLLADNVSPVLCDLQQRDRSLVSRLKLEFESYLGEVFSIERPWLKLAVLSVFLIFLALSLIPVSYRIEAPFQLQTREQARLTAPFQGYVEAVYIRTGHAVKKGELLASLDSTDLELEKSRILADLARSEAEKEEAQATNDLAAVRIARSRMDQGQASLELIENRLLRSHLISPFDGFVVEDNELMKRIGARIEGGEDMIRLARLDELIIDLKVDEKDIPQVLKNASGEIAFASRPDEVFPISIDVIEPMAIASESGNVFYLRAKSTVNHEDWWRPGMTGIGKIDAGKRSLLWLMTHRAVDWIRLQLWW